jgi:hypothetical protein
VMCAPRHRNSIGKSTRPHKRVIKNGFSAKKVGQRLG